MAPCARRQTCGASTPSPSPTLTTTLALTPTLTPPAHPNQAPDLWRRWGVNLGSGVHRLQLNLLMRGLSLMKDGGRLVYSTCSMNPVRSE